MKNKIKFPLFIFISVVFFLVMNGKLTYQYSDLNNFKLYLKFLVSLLFGYILIYHLFIFKQE
ncbi:MAG: hypothetical protein DCE86_10605 [Flavobacteriaceae bacterium]|jgi:glucan phosphoethanolaminetransferase (alkaline phosphatase superfamily)|nr:hypothetical protein ASG38_07240 [Flavobacterium sp. Leaf359]PZO29688.1 MAG: hypothetical protein DCE86_10605 [Flavobacteriaceae bacterium]PZQ86583.1 MAG: hypothetical protein DI548_06870 [Flavobacterium johnsoniae]